MSPEDNSHVLASSSIGPPSTRPCIFKMHVTFHSEICITLQNKESAFIHNGWGHTVLLLGTTHSYAAAVVVVVVVVVPVLEEVVDVNCIL